MWNRVVHTADVREEWDRLQYYWWHDPDFTSLRESVHNDSPLLTDKQNSWEQVNVLLQVSNVM